MEVGRPRPNARAVRRTGDPRPTGRLRRGASTATRSASSSWPTPGLIPEDDGERLLEAIRVVHAGEALLSPSITRRLIEDFASRTDPLPPTTALLEQITPREREVLVLVARGLSNSEIAERLVVTEATVKSHVGSILMKLDLRDRVQAVVFAYEHGIVAAGAAG